MIFEKIDRGGKPWLVVKAESEEEKALLSKSSATGVKTELLVKDDEGIQSLAIDLLGDWEAPSDKKLESFAQTILKANRDTEATIKHMDSIGIDSPEAKAFHHALALVTKLIFDVREDKSL